MPCSTNITYVKYLLSLYQNFIVQLLNIHFFILYTKCVLLTCKKNHNHEKNKQFVSKQQNTVFIYFSSLAIISQERLNTHSWYCTKPLQLLLYLYIFVLTKSFRHVFATYATDNQINLHAIKSHFRHHNVLQTVDCYQVQVAFNTWLYLYSVLLTPSVDKVHYFYKCYFKYC